MRIPRKSTLVAMLSLVVAAACSQGSSGGASSGSAREEYIERADKVCEDTEARIQALEPPATTNELDDYALAIEDISNDAIVELRSLEPPPGDEAVLKQIIDNIERSVELLPEYARATQAQDAATFRRVEAELQELQDQTVQMARSYGFENCGADEGAPAQ